MLIIAIIFLMSSLFANSNFVILKSEMKVWTALRFMVFELYFKFSNVCLTTLLSDTDEAAYL